MLGEIVGGAGLPAVCETVIACDRQVAGGDRGGEGLDEWAHHLAVRGRWRVRGGCSRASEPWLRRRGSRGHRGRRG